MKLPSKQLPFASITERPYPQAALAGVDWYAIEPTFVELASLHLTQTHCTILGLFGQRYSTDPHVRVVQWNERLYVEDGHHRLVETAIQRVPAQTTLARVLRNWYGIDALPTLTLSWPNLMYITRGQWANLQHPNKQEGGRYWPNGKGDPEYSFHAEDDIGNLAKPWPDQIIIFRRTK